MTLHRRSLAVVLVVTCVIVTALLVLNPFGYLRRGLIHLAGAGPEDAAVRTVWRDETTQEVSNGQRPKVGLDVLSQLWLRRSDAKRAVLIGNSQTLAMVLAPGEAVTGKIEKTYPDIIFNRLRECRQPVEGYRLAAPNLSYMEAVFYLDYLLTKPELRPARLVLQLNYESFRKPGIRDGMLELLSDKDFFRTAREEASRPTPYAATFQSAIERFMTSQAKAGAAGVAPAGSTKTGITQSFGLGNRFEQRVRRLLERLPGWRTRGRLKADSLETLYLLRVYLLRITPTTRRSIGGATLEENRSSIERIGQLCRDYGIELILFNAPQNPLAPLYRTAQDYQNYRNLIHDLAAEYGTSFFDFEQSIPKEYWGRWIDGPDPIHFGRAGHDLLARLMIESGVFGKAN